MFTKRNLILSLLLVFFSALYAQPGDEDKVIHTFKAYAAAVLSDSGMQAADLVDKRTIQYYAKVLDAVRTYDSARVAALPMVDRLMIFTIRHNVSKEIIHQFNSTTLFAFAVVSGMIGDNSVTGRSIGGVNVKNDKATAVMMNGGVSTGIECIFYKENGAWKYNLTSMLPATNTALEKLAESCNIDQDVYLFSVLELSSGRAPGNEIWQAAD